VALISLRAQGSVVEPAHGAVYQTLRPDLVWQSLGAIPHLGFLGFPAACYLRGLVLVASSNAVNLTDGLDGLAIGCTIVAASALTVLTYVSGHVVFSDYLELQRMPLVAK
jgi:phospho-N-acetylmuramoyl-pentapeptide-transferase